MVIPPISGRCPTFIFQEQLVAMGVGIQSLPWLLLVAVESEDGSWSRSAYDRMTLTAEHMELVGATHWGLVLNRRLLRGLSSRVTDWLNATLAFSPGQRAHCGTDYRGDVAFGG